MSGAPLEGAKKALAALVRRLDPTDNFGLVTFDDSAQVVVPAGPLTDKEGVLALIEGVYAGGMTDLSTGYLRGLRELRRVAGNGGTVLVISDGHVNGGIQDVDQFASITAKAYGDGIVTSTLGYGRSYDETLLSAISRAGSGNHVFADDPDAAGAAIAAEVDGLLNKVVQGLALTVSFESSVQFVRLYNDLPAQQLADGTVMIELGDLYAKEGRKVLLKFKVPAIASLGLARIATLNLAYVELPGLIEHVAALPIHVNVVPGDEAAGRVPHPAVRSELLFQEAQETKRRASEAFERGDAASAMGLLAETQMQLRDALEAAPEGVAEGIRAELDEVGHMGDIAPAAPPQYMSKLSRGSYHRSSRKRGREPRPDQDDAS